MQMVGMHTTMLRRQRELELEEDRPEVAWRRPVVLDDGLGCRFCAIDEGDWLPVAKTAVEFEEHMMYVHGRTVL